MTQEDKQLLLIDLCARLPYGVKCKPESGSYIVAYSELEKICKDVNGGFYAVLADRDVIGNKLASTTLDIYDWVRPYLRPMSSITEEEKKELNEITHKWFLKGGSFDMYVEIIDFYNSHHFDYRGLIEKDLALEATEGMYNIKEQ